MKDKKRRGVTLLITLSVISAMIALIGIAYGYLDVVRKKADSRSALLEAELLKSDISKFIKKYIGDKSNNDSLKLLYSTPLPIITKSNEFSVMLKCNPLFGTVPMIWLSSDIKKKFPKRYKLANALFQTVAQEYELRDYQLLLSMIQDKLGGDAQKYGVSNYLNRAKDIITIKSFREILDNYSFKTDDTSVFTVDWSRYFYFGFRNRGLDKEYLTPELVSYLYNQDINFVKDEYQEGNLDKFLKSIGEDGKRYSWLFDSNISANMHCKVDYLYREAPYSFGFDNIEQRVINFEFYN